MKDKEKIKELIKELKAKATADRDSQKRPPMTEGEVRLKYAETPLEPDTKRLIEFGRIKNGCILHLIRTTSIHDAQHQNHITALKQDNENENPENVDGEENQVEELE